VKYLILLSLFFFCSCDEENSSEFLYDGSGACTLIGTSNQLAVDFYKNETLKEFLAFSINASDILYDDCNLEDEQREALEENSFFYTANIYALADYFPNGTYPVRPPVTSLINVKVYHRSSCDEDLELHIDETTEVEWEPLYPNGERCGVVAYSGTVEVSKL